MSKVKFVSLDKKNRKVTLDVDGIKFTRGIAENVGDEDLQEYIVALASGLIAEVNNTPKELTQSPYQAGHVIDDVA